MSKASDTIREYLEVGGLFNPEIMNQWQHEAVRKTLIDAREDIERLERELSAAKQITGETSDGYHTFNELYEHRHALFLALAQSNYKDAWMCKKHGDGSEMEGWFIAGIDLWSGSTISYHLPMRLWEACKETGATALHNAPKWDGHTSKDVIDRLMKYATE